MISFMSISRAVNPTIFLFTEGTAYENTNYGNRPSAEVKSPPIYTPLNDPEYFFSWSAEWTIPSRLFTFRN
jgi:hypothetical protein